MTSGPRTLDHFVKQHGIEKFSLPSKILQPNRGISTRAILDPGTPDASYEFAETVSIHIHGATKQHICEHHGGILPEGCYLDRLCRRHGIDPAEFPIGERKTTGTVAKGKVRAAAAE